MYLKYISEVSQKFLKSISKVSQKYFKSIDLLIKEYFSARFCIGFQKQSLGQCLETEQKIINLKVNINYEECYLTFVLTLSACI